MTDTAAPKPRSPLWIKLVLGLSILLNLGLGGVLLGIATGGARDGSVMSAAIAALPQDSRRDLRRALRADWAELRGYRRAQPVPSEILTLLRAEPFDPVAFDASLERGRAHLAEMGQRQRARLTAEVAAMTPAGRQAYALALEERLQRGRPPRP